MRDDGWFFLGDFSKNLRKLNEGSRTARSIYLNKMDQISMHKIAKYNNSHSPLQCFQLSSHLMDTNFVS